MVELAGTMIDSDFSGPDPVNNLHNLHEVPLLDFLILHKIYPKMFMLEVDSYQASSSRIKRNHTGNQATGSIESQNDTTSPRSQANSKIKLSQKQSFRIANSKLSNVLPTDQKLAATILEDD